MRGRDGRRAERRKGGKQKNGAQGGGAMKKGRVNEEKESWRKEEGDEGRRVKCGDGRPENFKEMGIRKGKRVGRRK